jgi:creatinine amidohydrolase
MRERQLANLTRSELHARSAAGASCLLPIGSLEQHGEHLPLGTDTLLAHAVCLRAAELTESDIIVAPPLWAGFSPHHLRFGATVSLAPETFLAMVRDVARGLREMFATVVVVNGHGGNRGLLSSLTLELDVRAIDYWELAPAFARDLFPQDGGSVGHAGELETSLVLASEPDLVGEPALEFEPCLPGDMLLYGPDLGASGVIGDPHAASAESGAAFLEACSVALARLLAGTGPGRPA